MSDSDLEALVNLKIKNAIRAAVDKIGEKELSRATGIAQSRLDLALQSEDEYLPVKAVSVACQINKSYGDPNLEHSRVSECLKGATIRLPPRPKEPPDQGEKMHRPPPILYGPKRPVRLIDQKSVKLINFGGNTISFLILGYFLGGIALGPLFGQGPCLGVSLSPPAATPCLGSILGLVTGAISSLAYTVYFFVKKM